jgi:hypothetical protein
MCLIIESDKIRSSKKDPSSKNQDPNSKTQKPEFILHPLWDLEFVAWNLGLKFMKNFVPFSS